MRDWHRQKCAPSQSASLTTAHSTSNFLSLLAVRVARDERQEIVQRHDEITPGAALCIAVECDAVMSELGLPSTAELERSTA